MIKNKKGATLALVAQALALISIMFMITAMSVIINTNVNYSKATMLEVRANTAQFAYDFINIHQNNNTPVLSGFVGIYESDKGWTEASFTRSDDVDTYILQHTQSNYKLIVTEQANNTLTLRVTNKRGNKIYLIVQMNINEENVFELSSYQLRF